ncbi:MAG: metallophosphoesterase [Verrucomicrobiota bacterium]
MKSFFRRSLRQVWFSLALFWLFAARVVLGEAPPPVDGGFTLAVLPDTQIYAWKFPETYPAQTKWIASNAKKYNIAYVLHVGDITQHNTNDQWRVAAQAHALLDARVPCALTVGNHDLGPNGNASSRQTALNEFFPVATLKKWPTFGGVYDKEPERTENNFHLFEAGGRKWLILALEFGPRDDVLRWANDVVKRHADRSAILVTHAYLRPDNSRFDRRIMEEAKKNKVARNKGLDGYALSKAAGGFNDGEDIWQKLVSQHANFALVVSGHVCVTGRLDSQGKHGNTVHQMVVDYQNQKNGGEGYLRLLQFHPDGKTVTVRDYSPVLDQISGQPGANYEFTIEPAAVGKSVP